MRKKRKHDFGDTINAMCACGKEVETTEHFLLRCHLYSPQRFVVKYIKEIARFDTLLFCTNQ